MIVNRVNQLRQVELFSALDVDDLRAIAELAQEERHTRGALVCRQGDPGHRFCLVEEGELRAWHVDPAGIEEEVARFGPGDCFGESALLLGEPHDATIEVAESAVLLVIDKKDLDRLLEERPAMLDDLRMAPEVERRWRAPRFDWQEPDEAVVFVLHKHDVVLFRNLLLPGIVLLLVLAGYFVVGSTSMLGLLMGGLLASAPLLWALYQIVDHFNDNYILTNKRVMHDEYIYLIRQSRVGAPLTNIQSVQVIQEGAMAQMFGFGDVHIETAGEPGGRIVFQQIPDPGRMQQMILEQRERAEARTRAEERANIEEALRDRFGQGPAEEEGTDGEEAGDSSEEGAEARWPVWVVAPMRVVRYFFPVLREEEGDTITWRKHWVALLRPIALPSVAILLVTLVVAGLLVREEGDRGSILLSYFILLVFLVPWWLWVFEDWQNELYQVTSTRIIDVERLPFGLREERREASLGMIQNVNLRVPGVIGRLFGYGSVTIETAGSGAFTFDYVKDPQAVQTEIFRRMAAFTERKRQEAARRRRDELLDWFTVYDEMRNEEAGGGEGFAPGGARGGSSSR
ncbi:MAG: cyclic nucleotide-binding domain-containing protein [Chloroflexota bacterium]